MSGDVKFSRNQWALDIHGALRRTAKALTGVAGKSTNGQRRCRQYAVRPKCLLPVIVKAVETTTNHEPRT
jgi:hypothetical protein